MIKNIEREISFLEDEYSFKKKIGQDFVVYSSDKLILHAEYNERDGFDISVIFRKHGDKKVSIGTVLAALDKHRPLRFSNPTKQITYCSKFVAINFIKLSNITKDMYIDCSHLRFWHAVDWRDAWETTIKMREKDVNEEKSRLKRIQEYFERPKMSALP